MRRRALATATVLSCWVLFLARPVPYSRAADDGDAKRRRPAADFFGLTKIVKLDIQIPAEEYQAMQPPAPPAAGAPGGPPPVRRPGSPGSEQANGTSLASSFAGRAGTSR